MNIARYIKDKGTNRYDFDVKKVNKYTWVSKGGSFGLGEINASILYHQLKNLIAINNKRKFIWNKYCNLIMSSNLKNKIILSKIYFSKEINGHIFFLILKEKKLRNRLINYLRKNNIEASFHYLPLHKSKLFKNEKKNSECINSSFVSEAIIRLPMHLYLKNNEQIQIIKKIDKFFQK